MKKCNWLILVLVAVVNVRAYAQPKSKAIPWDKLPQVTQPSFKADTFNILQFGAKPDGQFLNTQMINQAIVACNKMGGGVVLIPGGIWLTGPVEMKSNVNLHLVRDAILLFTADFDQYPLVEGIYEGKRSARNQSPVFGNNLVNIAITGKGIIDGNGDAWRMVKKDKLTENEWKAKLASGGSVSSDGKTWFPSAKTKLAHETSRTSTMEPGQSLKDFDAIKDFLRPNLVVFNSCKNVLLDGVTFQNSPAWCIHPVMCENLTVRNVFVKNPDYAQNGDGIDVESCKNVLVENSTFDVGDDAICIKSGKDEEGRKRGIPTENVIVRRNVVYKGHGGFVIGSEMSGGARNIFVYDCSFIGTDNGLRFKTARGRGGIVENIYIDNIRMKDIVRDAILFDMYYFTKPPGQNEVVETPPVTEATPRFRDFFISNVVCNGAERGIFMRGLPEMSVQQINLSNMVIRALKGAELIATENIMFQDVQLISENGYPVVYIENGKSISLKGIEFAPDANLWYSINGANNANIRVEKNSLLSSSNKVEYHHGANPSMVQMN